MKLRQDQLDALTESGIPEYMHGGIIRYYQDGIAPGDFLCAIINNDLRGACSHADATNMQVIGNYIQWFYNEAPAGTWGYNGAVESWLKRFWVEEKVASSA